MSCDSAAETGGFKYIWRIENFSKCALEDGNNLISPKFVVEDIKKTAWFLSTFDYVECYLNRDTVDGGPRSMNISYSISFTKSDGVDDTKLVEMEFMHGQVGFVFLKYHRKEIFDNRPVYLPKDTLTVECHIQKDTSFRAAKVECTATTRVTVERVNFTWTIKNFLSNSDGFARNYEKVIHPVTKGKNPPSISVKLSFNDTDRNKMKVHLSKNKNKSIFVAFRLRLVDVNKIMHDFCAGERFLRNNETEWVHNPTLTIQQLQERGIFLVDNSLSVRCEFELSFGLSAYAIEQQMILPQAEPKPQRAPNQLTTDLRSMFVDQKFCDVSFRVEGKTLGAHRLILCARSPVFSAMFDNNMREKRDDSVNIYDLDYETLRRMLMFLYTDAMDDSLEFESVLKLYGAADKYQIESLRGKCVVYLKHGISVDNFCEVLAAGDLHQDDNLVNAVKYFMTSHLQEIMTWGAWKDFMENNFLLAIETLRQVLNKTAND